MAADTDSMPYLLIFLLCIFLIPGEAAEKTGKRPAGKQSSLSSVRNKPKYNLKPLVYDAKKNRPVTVKKRHWWQKK